MNFEQKHISTIARAKEIALANKKIELVLVRKWFTTNSTIGILRIGDLEYCYTLEDFVRPDGEKVYGKTAIPYGNYNIKLTFSQRFKRVLPLIENVFNFTGIRIHPGNRPENTLGCVLVGFNKGQDQILNSQKAFNPLFDFLSWGKQNNLPITINVTNFERQFVLGAGTVLGVALLITILTKYVS